MDSAKSGAASRGALSLVPFLWASKEMNNIIIMIKLISFTEKDLRK